MPAALHDRTPALDEADPSLGPRGPFPDIALRREIERRWLHYAFLSDERDLGLVSNIAWLGPAANDPLRRTRNTAIVLMYDRHEGWSASQFNALVRAPAWSAFRLSASARVSRFEIASSAQAPGVDLTLRRSSHPCTSQCVAFTPDQHFRWQSETGIHATGMWRTKARTYRRVRAIGYHERVRGCWGWPELGGWVFGFANAPTGKDGAPPPYALVFTLVYPQAPAEAATASVMLWQDGRLRRHFTRRNIDVAVRGLLEHDRVRHVPALSQHLGVFAMAPIPRLLVIDARQGRDRVLLEFECRAAARIVIPSESGLSPFSVHEVIGPCHVSGLVNGKTFGFETRGIVEFAGGAHAD
ncbi:MAG: hypothetical protein IT531_16180 [Burkholderiales bacterium]|nr:hypothetical protein [Burkholderiales bacterium]